MNKISPRVIEVTTLDNYKILLKFDNMEQKIFDVSPYLKYEIFMPLKDLNEFNKTFIDFGTVCWECGADFSRDTLYIRSVCENEVLSQ